EETAKQRPPPVPALDQDAERVEHAVDIEWRWLDRDEQKVCDRETVKRGLGSETRCVDDDEAAASGEPPCGVGGLFSRVLDHGNPAERAFARDKPHDRALRIGVDQAGTPAAQMPMHGKAACQRALAAAALHCGHSDDHAAPRRSCEKPAQSESADGTVSDSRRTAYCRARRQQRLLGRHSYERITTGAGRRMAALNKGRRTR